MRIAPQIDLHRAYLANDIFCACTIDLHYEQRFWKFPLSTIQINPNTDSETETFGKSHLPTNYRIFSDHKCRTIPIYSIRFYLNRFCSIWSFIFDPYDADFPPHFLVSLMVRITQYIPKHTTLEQKHFFEVNPLSKPILSFEMTCWTAHSSASSEQFAISDQI